MLEEIFRIRRHIGREFRWPRRSQDAPLGRIDVLGDDALQIRQAFRLPRHVEHNHDRMRAVLQDILTAVKRRQVDER